MGYKLGGEGKLYYCLAGIGGTPAWTLIPNVRDLKLPFSKGEADVTTRANNGWRATVGTLKEAEVNFQMVYDPDDTGFSVVMDAYMNNTTIGIAAMDGDLITPGSQGLWADCGVTKFEVSAGLEEALLVDITIKPTYSANAPRWYVSPGGTANLVATGEGLPGAGTYVLVGEFMEQDKYRFTDSGNVVWSLFYGNIGGEIYKWQIRNDTGGVVYQGPALEAGPEGNYVHGDDTLVVAEEA